jgi:hypothetical protein
MKMKRILYLLPLVAMFASCEVEFTPNAEWKNIPVVYCLLDQDDDTTWARVERCYLTEGNLYSYGNVSDSINYPQGSITVSLLAYENGTLKDSMAFEYTERDRDSGHFAYQRQPLYYFPTKGRLKEDYSYVLSVRDAATQDIIASTEAISLIKKTDETLITKPDVKVYNGDTLQSGGFRFNSPASGDAYCEIQWNALENARLYQPFVRFYYTADGRTQYVDVMCPRTTSKNNYVRYSRNQFLSDLKLLLEVDTSYKYFHRRVDLYLTSCTEDLSTYMSTVNQATSVTQANEAYNNIQGGVGIFAARRTHLYKRMNADESLKEGQGLLWFLVNLGVNLH